MSEALVIETFKTIPPNELLEVHARLKSPIAMSRNEANLYASRARTSYIFGCYLQSRTIEAGWDEQFTNAVHSGSDRLFLSTLNWLQTKKTSEAKAEAIRWLGNPMSSFIETVMDEVHGFTGGHQDTTAVAEDAEVEIREYPAFVALTTSLEAELFEQGLTMKEAVMERLGAALAALAIKRQLAKSEVAALEALFALE